MITLAPFSRAASAAQQAALPAPTTMTSGLPKSVVLITFLSGIGNRETGIGKTLMQRLRCRRAPRLGFGARRRGRGRGVMRDHAPAALRSQIDVGGDDRAA